ncbi:hypothetical protein R1flu_013050 [Riccia fluitans]|uniref:Uncharacterized protein n=1 Tax=Riccia fluitans TaxID=41844 RepID=A0ABD1ZCC5_9MARC
MSIGHGALPAAVLWAQRAGEWATGSAERAGVLQRPATALRMAARKAASSLRALAAVTLKCPRGHFRVREWERERVKESTIRGRNSFLFSF